MPTSTHVLHRLPAQYAPKRMVPSLCSSLGSSQGRRRQMSCRATLLPKLSVPYSFAGKPDRTFDLRLLPYDADVCTWRTVCEVCGVQSCDTCEHELRRPSSAAATAKVCPALLIANAKKWADFWDALSSLSGTSGTFNHYWLIAPAICSTSGAGNGGAPAPPSGAPQRPTITQSVVVENPPSLDQDGNEVGASLSGRALR